MIGSVLRPSLPVLFLLLFPAPLASAPEQRRPCAGLASDNGPSIDLDDPF